MRSEDLCRTNRQADQGLFPTALLLSEVLERIGPALEGRAGARWPPVWACTWVLPPCCDWYEPLPDPPTNTVEVLGINNFALRRRHRYGTVLLDMSTHRPLDVLADRRAETVVEWLRAHHGIEVICRDCAGVYTQAARAGVPEAIEVANRWQLWHDLAEKV